MANDISKYNDNVMALSDASIQMLAKLEGIEYKPYKCSAGLLTIGVGHVIGKGKQLKQIVGRARAADLDNLEITYREVAQLLGLDLMEFVPEIELDLKDVKRGNKKESNYERELDAFTLLTFNIGLRAYGDSTARRLYKLGYSNNEIIPWILAWHYVGKDKNRGLAKRRTLEAAIFSGDIENTINIAKMVYKTLKVDYIEVRDLYKHYINAIENQ